MTGDLSLMSVQVTARAVLWTPKEETESGLSTEAVTWVSFVHAQNSMCMYSYSAYLFARIHACVNKFEHMHDRLGIEVQD